MPVGTFQNRMVEAASAKCETPIEILSLPKMPDVLQAVRTGRADATVNGYATSVYTTANQVGNGKGLQALPDIRLAVNLVAWPGYNRKVFRAVIGGSEPQGARRRRASARPRPRPAPPSCSTPRRGRR